MGISTHTHIDGSFWNSWIFSFDLVSHYSLEGDKTAVG